MSKIKKHPVWFIFLLIVLFFAVYTGVGIVRSLYLEATLISVVLPSKDGAIATVRVAQISDLHRAMFGENNRQLVELIESKQPDVIFATGDMVDARAGSIEPALDLFAQLVKIAPVVYSLGNHEVSRSDMEELWERAKALGVHCVNNDAVELTLNGVTLNIGGLYHAERLRQLDDDGQIDLLLCHFPEKIGVYAKYGVPLTFSGHTHGGQFRIPFFDIAIYAPGQGFFPQYTTGLYEENGSYMIVSRGLGNSTFPFRIHNPPEVIIADIHYTN